MAKELKYLKFFEAGDTIFKKGRKVDFGEAYTYAFMLFPKTGKVAFSKEKKKLSYVDKWEMIHGAIFKEEQNDRKEFNYPAEEHIEGRIWLNRFVLSFWNYDFADINAKEDGRGAMTIGNKKNTLTFRETLNLLQEEFNKQHRKNIDFSMSRWRIDVPVQKLNFDYKDKDTYEYYATTYQLIPFKEFEKGVLIDTEGHEESKKIHLMDYKEREEYWKNKEKPKVGSSKPGRPIQYKHALGKFRGESIKLNETADTLVQNDKIVSHNDSWAFPFFVTKDWVRFGDESKTHGNVDTGNLPWQNAKRGRIWLDRKIISFWDITTDNLKETFSHIQDEFNQLNIRSFIHKYDSIDEYESSNKSAYKINFFDGSWKIDVFPYMEGFLSHQDKTAFKEKYKGYKPYTIPKGDDREGEIGYLIPLLDFIKINGEKLDIELDEETYKIHLLSAEQKNKALKDAGAKPKIHNWKEWQKPFESIELNETADSIIINDREISIDAPNSYPFLYDEETEEFKIGKESTSHSYNGFGKGDLTGRIFVGEKIISIWFIENYTMSDLKNVIKHLSEELKININNNWKFDIPIGDLRVDYNVTKMKYDGSFTFNNYMDEYQDLSNFIFSDEETKELYYTCKEKGYKTYVSYDRYLYAYIPVEDFINNSYKAKTNEEAYRIHLLDPEQKNKALKSAGAKPKVKNWKDWQKPFENKLNEIADAIILNDKRIDYNTDLAFPFVLNNKGKIVIGNEYQMHTDKNYYDEIVSGSFHGRIWLDKKIIGFWWKKDKKELLDVLTKAQEEFNKGNFIVRSHDKDMERTPIKDTKYKKYLPINFFDGEWRLDIGPIGTGFGKTPVDDVKDYDSYDFGGTSKYLLIPVTDYLEMPTQINIDEEKGELMRQYHVATGLEKSRLAKLLGLNKYIGKVHNWKEWQKPFESIQYEDNDFDNEKQTINYVEDGEVIGHLNYLYTDGYFSSYLPNNLRGELYIDYIEVDEEYRNRGIAQQLIKRAIEDAKTRGMNVVTLKRDTGMGCNYGSEEDKYLEYIYTKLGFVNSFTEEECEENDEKNICGMHLYINNRLNEMCDEIEDEKGYAMYTDTKENTIIPFIVYQDGDKLFTMFGPNGSAHMSVPTPKNGETEVIRGRLFITKKLITFWELYSYNGDEKELFETIQNDMNKHFRTAEVGHEYDFFDGKWRLDIQVGTERTDPKYFKYTIWMKDVEYYFILVPINDYLEDNYEIKPDSEAYKIHLKNAEEKNKALKSMGAKPKIRNWKEWQKPFESLDKLKRYSNKLSNIKWKPETQSNDIEYITGIIIDDFEEYHDEDWSHIIDNQELGDCQSIVSGIKHLNIPGMKYHFGEITVKVPIDDDYYDKIMTHHWCSYKGQILEFSKGTLKNYVDWNDIYSPHNDEEIEYTTEINVT